MQIGDKMFAYIQNHEDLSLQMLSEYRNSMIFLGDQKQIYVPIINTYVGLGQDAYTYLLNKLGEENDNLNNLYTHINNNYVTSIYAQYSPKDIDNYRLTSSSTPDASIACDIPNGTLSTDSALGDDAKVNRWLKANRNVVIRGIKNNDPIFNTSVNSGITVTIKHEGGNYVTGENEFGTYSYWNPEHDIISIDDTYTWSYIKSLNSYLINFTTEFASQQANRIYKNIIGENNPVYIEKETSEVILFDENGVPSFIGDVYVRTKDFLNGNYVYAETRITTDNNSTYIEAYLNGEWRPIYVIPTDGANDATLNTWNNISEYLASIANGGYETKGNLQTSVTNEIPVWYHLDTATTSTYNIDLNDGINTIKEVAYLLDTITNGDETGINLAYNISNNFVEIQELKKWKENIGSAAVQSIQSESFNDYLTVTYYALNSWSNDAGASGNVKVDLDLLIAKTYDSNNNSYAAYLKSHYNQLSDVDKRSLYYIVDNEDYYENYIQVQSLTDDLVNQLLDYYGNSYSMPFYVQKSDGTYTLVPQTHDTVENIKTYYNNLNYQYRNDYIYWPYRQKSIFTQKSDHSIILNGLTTVDWVTTYVGWGLYDVNNRIDNINVNSDIENFVATLYAYSGDAYGHGTAYSDETNIGLYVSYVTEHNGIIEVHKNKLPLDKILTSNVYPTNDVYISISKDQAIGININPSNTTELYGKLTGKNGLVPISDSIDLSSDSVMSNYDENGFKIKVNNVSTQFTAVNGSTNISDLITNLGKVSYFYKQTTGSNTEYIPLDIQSTYTNNTASLYDTTNGTVNGDGKIYYLNNNVVFNKYIEAFTYQNKDGSTSTTVTSYITYLNAASENRTGLADAWDVRRTIESMFTWVNIQTNTIITD